VSFLPWLVALLAGTLAGAATCAGFVVRRSRFAVAALAATVAAVLLSFAIVAVWQQTERPDAPAASILIAVGALVGGYALASELLPALTRRRPVPTRLDTLAPQTGIGLILLADAESPDYRAVDVTGRLDALERADVPLPPHVARPFVYASERARYRVAGGSPSRRAVNAVAASLTERLRGTGFTGPVETAFCGGGPSAAEAVARLAARTGGRVVVATLTVAWTPAFDKAAAEVHALDRSGRDLDVDWTEPLWASHEVAIRAAERAFAAFGDDAVADGIVLVAFGNPWQFDRAFPTAMEQTTFLSQRIRSELIEAGLPSERVRQAWLEWEEPDVREAVRHLAALGARRVALLPVDLLYESLATAVDLPMATERAAEESDVRVALAQPMGDDPAIVAALQESVLATIGRKVPGGEPEGP
jgi:protoheme ferro-lyase